MHPLHVETGDRSSNNRAGCQSDPIASSTVAKMAGVEEKDDLCAIFVHAGAGFHSRENERNHLSVCAQYVPGLAGYVSKLTKSYF